jgi:hypothetical protein
MVAEEVSVYCYNFNPIRVKHASIQVKSTGTPSQKRFPIRLSGAGAEAGAAIPN